MSGIFRSIFCARASFLFCLVIKNPNFLLYIWIGPMQIQDFQQFLRQLHLDLVNSPFPSNYHPLAKKGQDSLCLVLSIRHNWMLLIYLFLSDPVGFQDYSISQSRLNQHRWVDLFFSVLGNLDLYTFHWIGKPSKLWVLFHKSFCSSSL